MPGASANTHGLACKWKKHTSVVATGEAVSPAFPARWFYGFLRALPGDLALLPPSSARCKASSANLTPALACQDHTTSPSASASLVWRHQYVHRIPRPTLVTIAKRPFWRARDAAEMPLIWGK